MNWYDMHAFCIWDGGFLPSEAEWEYVASGGSDERSYPWGSAAISSTLSVYAAPTGATTSIVGSKPSGLARWGHLDVSGNAFEWTIDRYVSSWSTTCDNCAVFTGGTSPIARSTRGGSFRDDQSMLSNGYRTRTGSDAYRYFEIGGRCARTP
jgi:formylglycine-generating enzyme required for sulfatase activity